MNFCGIISEFNPFHNGHKYIIEQAKKNTGCDVICLMSGNFVQRGEPAIIDKYTRASFAVQAGAAAVLELPCVYACSNAENFAYGAIKILKAIGVKYIAFGVEHADLETLTKIAKLKVNNSLQFQNAFKNEIENGINFNTALKRSIAKTLNDNSLLSVLEKPNNILAIEYLTAILKQNANIKPVAIERSDNGFLSSRNNDSFLSAAALRGKILSNESIADFIPKNANFVDFFDKNHTKTLNMLQILKIKQTPELKLNEFYDYQEGIEFRIKKACNKALSFEEIKNFICTPRYRIQRVNKLLLYPLLGITKKINNLALKSKPYAKVLAINKSNKKLLTVSKSKINLIASNKDYKNLSANQNKIAEIDLNASLIYNTIFDNKILDDKKKGTLYL